MKKLHGWKYDKEIILAFNYFGPMDVNTLTERMALRLSFIPPVKEVKEEIARLVKAKAVVRSSPAGYYTTKVKRS